MNDERRSDPMEADPSDKLAKILNRHRAFWERSQTDQALLRVQPWEAYQPYKPFVSRDGTVLADTTEILPGLLDPVANLNPNRPEDLFDGEFLRGWGPYDVCWTEAVLGCRVFRAGPSVWTQQLLDDWSQVDRLSWEGASPWLDELLEVNRLLVAETNGRYPVTQPLMRGPLDMVEAAVDTKVLYLGFCQHADETRRLLDLCADIFIAIAERRLAQTSPFHGGYMVRAEWGLWAPGAAVQFQADAMRNLSAELYREFLFDIDRRIAGRFEYSFMHTHSCSAHILPVLATEPELKAIEVTIDPQPYGPRPIELMEAFQLVQDAGKSLLISGPMMQEELDQILRTLSPAGLAIRAGLLSQ